MVGLTWNEAGLRLATNFKKTFGLVPTWNCSPPSSKSAVQPVWVQVPRNYFFKALFFEKPGFHNQERAAENTVLLADGGEATAFILRYPLSLFSCKTCIENIYIYKADDDIGIARCRAPSTRSSVGWLRPLAVPARGQGLDCSGGAVRHGSRKWGSSYPAPVSVGVPEWVASLRSAPERGVKALGD